MTSTTRRAFLGSVASLALSTLTDYSTSWECRWSGEFWDWFGDRFLIDRCPLLWNVPLAWESVPNFPQKGPVWPQHPEASVSVAERLS